MPLNKLLRMSRAFRKRRKPRHYLMLLVALMLLWQQMALAANMYPLSGVITPSAVPSAIQGMFKATRHAPAGVRSCASSALVPSDDTSPTVRGSLLLPLAAGVQAAATLLRMEASVASAHQRSAYHPPIRLLFCSLLI